MTNKELLLILERHAHWLAKDVDGWKTMKAYLVDADLRRVNLRDADLRGADLVHADLRGADLRGADLRGADLRNADCRDADFSCANLIGAATKGADFSYACFYGATVPDDIWPLACPEKGEFTGWKFAWDYRDRPVIVEIVVPEDAKRSSATGRKCRCSKAVIKDVCTLSGEYLPDMHLRSYTTGIRSDYNPDFRYFVGDTIVIDDFDDNRWNECAKGFHFFITRAEAEKYMPLHTPYPRWNECAK